MLFAEAPHRFSVQALVNKPWNQWTRVSHVVNAHCGKSYHINAQIKAKSFIKTIEQPNTKITNALNRKKLENIRENRSILKHIIKAIIYLTKQGLALRGHDESANSRNRGNFLELLTLIGEYSPEVKAHIEKQAKTSYISPVSQNELIKVIGVDCIRAAIVEEINKARFFSIIADEASSSCQEYLSLTIRYVSADNTIKEEFVNFHRVGRCTGQLLGLQILERVDAIGLDIRNCRGQGYDGAAAMSSDEVGVMSVIKERAPNAIYLHCASHCLNLVITSACKITSIRKAIDRVSAVSYI